MHSSPTQRISFFALILFSIVATALDAEDLTGVPAKINVSGKASETGEPGVKITVELRDPENKPARASDNIDIEVQGKTESDKVERSKVTIKRGETAATIELPIKESGLLEVTATNPQLAQGGTLVELRTAGERLPLVPRPSISPQLENPPHPLPNLSPIGSVAAPPPVGAAARSPSSGRIPYAARRARAEAPASSATPAPSSPAISRALVSAATPAPEVAEGPPPPTNWSPVLKLGYYPTRKLRADENDPATIWAALQDRAAPVDTEVHLMSDLGPVTPDPIKIRRGNRMGTGQLIANYPGAIHVWYQYSTPSGTTPDAPLMIKFTPPVWGLSVEPTVPRINLFESAELAVEPINFHKGAVLSDGQREVYLSIVSGSGELGASTLTFQPNQGRVSTKFIPTGLGAVQLKARSDSLPDAFAVVTVTMPYLLTSLCAFGSLLGGLLAYWTEQAATRRRIVIGLVTGFVLYWAFLFGVVHIPSFPHAFVENPLSAVILPFFGGWGGTKVITMVLKQMGLDW